MSYTREEQRGIFTQLIGRLLREPTARMLDTGAPTEEQRLTHVSHQQFDIEPGTRRDLEWNQALTRSDYLNIVPIDDPMNDGGLMMILETEFTALALPGPPDPVTGRRQRYDPISVKTYSERYRGYGDPSNISEDEAFRSVLFDMENKILLDPPPPYLQDARRREASSRSTDPSLNNMIVARLGTVSELLTSLTEIRKSLMANPALDARLEEEDQAIRERYNIVIEAVTATNDETIIRYNWQGELGNQTRRAHRGTVSADIVEEWNRVSDAWEEGFVLRAQDGYNESSYDGTATSTPLQPVEREIDRLINYWKLFSSDPRSTDPVRRNLIRLDPEIAAYGINHINVRTEPLNDDWDKIISINVVYTDHNFYTEGKPHPTATFTPQRQLKMHSRAILESAEQEVQMAEVESRLLDFKETIQELQELASSPDSTIREVLSGILETTNRLDIIERRINRFTDEQMRNLLIQRVNAHRELLDPMREEYESMAAEADQGVQSIVGDPEVATGPETTRRIRANPEVQSALNNKRFILVDNKNRSIEFNLPIKKGTKSIQTLIIKYYLKDLLDTKLGIDDYFDEDTKKALSRLQKENQLQLINIMQGISPSEDKEKTSRYSNTPSQDFNQQIGIVDTPTYLFMYRGGLRAAATEAMDFLEGISGGITGTSSSTVESLTDRQVGDTPTEPWEDGDYIYHAYFTNTTRKEVNSMNPESYSLFLKNNSESALRNGVAQIFDFYRKDTSWEIKGSVEEHKEAYADLLSYQTRIDSLSEFDSSKRFTMTIESQSLSDNLQIPPIPPPDPDETSDVDLEAAMRESPKPVDVLFGQSLKPGARPIFASIHKIQSPTPRPGSTFKFIIRLRKKMFKEITYPPGSYRAMTIGETIEKARQTAKRVADFVENAPERMSEAAREARERMNSELNRAEEAIDNAEKSARAGLKWASQNKKEAAKSGAKSALRATKKYSREAEIQGLTGASKGLPLSNAQELARRTQLRARERDMESFPVDVSYPMDEFEKMIDKVSDMFLKYARDIAIFQLEGGRLDPYINFKKESENLRSVKAAVKRYLQKNGIAKSKPKDWLSIHFDETVSARKISKREMIVDRSGAVPLRISYERTGRKPKQDLMQGYPAILEKPPWNFPKTMNFLANLHDLYEAALESEENCFVEALDLVETPDEAMFTNIQKYTSPFVVVLKSTGGIFEIDTSSVSKEIIKLESQIKTYEDRLNEDYNLDGKNPTSNALRGKLIRFERGKTYSIIDPVPKEDLCTLEELYQEFLDKFDFEMLFCSYASCIPDIPWPISFKWDFDFSLPTLPDIPRWDPLAIMIPMIEAALLDLLIAFLCGIVRGILDLIGSVGLPSCQDLLDYGAAVWEDAFGSKEGTDKKLELMKKAAQSLERMNIPVGSFSDLADLFDALALALTPPEMCALLEGAAGFETLTITKNLIDNHYSNIKNFLTSEAEIQEFFEILGNFVDPALCAKLANSSEIILGDLCPDGNPSLRQRLEGQNATPEEIAEALVSAEKRRASLKDLFDRDPLAGFFDGNLPGPYDAPETNKMADLASKALMDNVAIAFKMDISSFVPSLFDMVSKQKEPGEAGFNPIEAAEYEFLKKQLQELKDTSRNRESDVLASYAQQIERDKNGFFPEEQGGLRMNNNGYLNDDGGINPDFHIESIFDRVHEQRAQAGNATAPVRYSLSRGMLALDDDMDAENWLQTDSSEADDIQITKAVLNRNNGNKVFWIIRIFETYYLFHQPARNAIAFLKNKLRAMQEGGGRIQKPGAALEVDKDANPIGYQCYGAMETADDIEALLEEAEAQHVREMAALERVTEIRGNDRMRLATGGDRADLQPDTHAYYRLKMEESRNRLLQIRASRGGKPKFYNLAERQDQMELSHIMQFPMRNMLDDAVPVPWLKRLLVNSDDTILASPAQYPAYDLGLGYHAATIPPAMEDDDNDDETPVQINPEAPLRVGETKNFEIKIALPTNIFDILESTDAPISNQSILYQEIPFVSSDNIKDCYNFHRPSRLLFNDWKGKTYRSEIPEEFLGLRRSARDIRLAPNEEKLLRPNAFAEIFCASWQSVLEQDETDISSEEVDGFRNSIWTKLVGTGKSDSSTASATEIGAYGMMSQYFLEKISESISESIFFDKNIVEDFGDFISSEFLRNEEKSCYVSNEGVINFDQMRKDMLSKYKKSLGNKNNKPENRDFSKPGPLEEGMISQLVIFYVKTYVLEFVLKGMYVFSAYSASEILKSEIISDYIHDYFVATIAGNWGHEAASSAGIDGNPFLEEVRKVGNDSNIRAAVKNILDVVLDSEDMSDTIDRIFSPSFKSLKEEFFNELSETATEVVSRESIRPNPENREAMRLNGIDQYRGLLPLHKSHDSGPRIFGGTTLSDLREYEQGKFYLEKYYKFSEEFIQNRIKGSLSQILEHNLIQEAVATLGPNANSPSLPELYFPFLEKRRTWRCYEGVFNRDEHLDLLLFIQSIIRAEDGIPVGNQGMNEGKANLVALAKQIKREIVENAFNTFRGIRLVFCPGKMTGIDFRPFKSVQNEDGTFEVVDATPSELAEQMAKKILSSMGDPDPIEALDPDMYRDFIGAQRRTLNLHDNADIETPNTIDEFSLLGSNIMTDWSYWAGVNVNSMINPGLRLEHKFVPKSELVAKNRAYIGTTTPHRSGRREAQLKFFTDFNAGNAEEEQKVRRLAKNWLHETFTPSPALEIHPDTSTNDYGKFRAEFVYGVPFVNVAYWTTGLGVAAEAGGDGGFRVIMPELGGALGINQVTAQPIGLMFPTPIASEQWPSCHREIFKEVEAMFEPRAFLDLGNPSQDQIEATEGVHLDRLRKLLNKVDDNAIRNALGLGEYIEDNGKRSLVEEPGFNMRYFFDFVFPLDRYQEMYTIYIQSMFDLSPDLVQIFMPTRKLTQKMVQALGDTDINTASNQLPLGGASSYNLLTSDQTSTGLGDAAMQSIPDISKIVEKMFKTFIPRLVRTVAGGLDPAYKDLKKTFDKNPRNTKAGLNIQSLSIESGELSTADLSVKNGFTPKKTFVPMNIQGPIDTAVAAGKIAAGMSMIPPGAGIPLLIDGAGDLLTITTRIENSITKRTSDRYGSFLTPFGLLAMGLSEMSGERYRDRLKKDPEQVFKVCDDNKPAGKSDPEEEQAQDLRDSINNLLGD